MVEHVETAIGGGGQAGLATSYCLSQQGREHVVLEKAAAAGNAWRNDRWDSFTLVTPNWAFQLPGAEYQGDAPHAFMPRAEVVARLEQYVEHYHLPVRYDTQVISVERQVGQYLVTTEDGALLADNVVMASGLFQRPKVPPFAADLPAGILQLSSGQYRNPQALPPGAVLVVGSAQSGCQIAEELYQSGRRVYLCLGGAGRVPRRYRGRDIVEWLHLIGFFDRTVKQLPSPRARFAGNPHVTGKDGGHTLNLHQFACDGVVLLGHLRGAQGDSIALALDVKESLAQADKAETDVLKQVDDYIQRARLDAPPETVLQLRDGYDAPEVAELDLRAAGIGTVIWAIGYTFDFSLVKLPILDADGYPVQERGATAYPGLFFVGLPWLTTAKSSLFLGVGEDAEHIASSIARGEGIHTDERG
jgi:putative flavoprotein involved in K+ transport